MRVEPADAATRRACRDKVWDAKDPRPQSDGDVRTFRAGSRITVTDNHDGGSDGLVTLTSPVFTDRPTLRGVRAVLTATTTLKCDAAPGLYPIYRHRPDDRHDSSNPPWARLRIAHAAPAAACSTSQATAHPSRTCEPVWPPGPRAA
ncbi:hypothetical protein [Streptomyces griseochromogenes]|uniref:hypothetical protein n=1 Tax=Streptomyces griseochromogenes TaxID=68214 RepID=UPI0037933524